MRQALEVSIKELREKVEELDKERKETEKETGLTIPITNKWSIPIINKDGTSDGWKLEGAKE